MPKEIPICICVPFLLDLGEVEARVDTDLEEDGDLCEPVLLYAGGCLAGVKQVLHNAGKLDQESKNKPKVDHQPVLGSKKLYNLSYHSVCCCIVTHKTSGFQYYCQRSHTLPLLEGLT